MPELDVRLEDEALFIVPASGALWIYDFGNKTEVLRDANEGNSGPVFQVAQATAGDMKLFLVLPTFAAASLAAQDRIFSMLAEHDAERPVALVVEQQEGRVVIVAGDAELVAPAAATAAVVRTCWEWDESESFSINVDQREYGVVAKHDGQTWTAAVHRARPK
ncbi:hypothetical protein [Enhygromyxa salina]|uniref:hypothetical protein n=1 Tax=Enhygromyxa salina TaxID=215803 RepID=UPI0011B25EF5|nr:hypothetical protein [Enhygromyxa salina]